MIIFDKKLSSTHTDLPKVIVLITEGNKALWIEHSEYNSSSISKIELLNDVFEIENLVNNKEQIEISLATSPFTIVPKVLSQFDTNKMLGSFNFNVEQHSTIEKTIAYDEKIAIIFSLKERNKEFFQKVSNIPFKHFTKELIAFVSKTNEDHLLLVVIDDLLLVSLQLNQQIHLVNSYPVKSIDEVLYYCMLIVQEFSIDPSTIKLTNVGDFTVNRLLHDQLSLYFLNIQYLHTDEITDCRYSGLIKLLFQ